MKKWLTAENGLRVLAVLGLVAVCFLCLAAGMARLHHNYYISIHSESMEPQLQKGDLAMVRQVPLADIKVGDVVAYADPKQASDVVARRVVGIPAELGPDNFQTKGDANMSPDTFISGSTIVGKVQYAVPHLGTFMDFVRSPIGLMLFVYLPALVLIAREVIRMLAYYRERRSYVAEGYEHEHAAPPRHAHLHFFRPARLLFVLLAVGALLAFLPIFFSAQRPAQINNAPNMPVSAQQK